MRGRPVARSIEYGGPRERRVQPAVPVRVRGPGLPTAAGADLRSKYADVPMAALAAKC